MAQWPWIQTANAAGWVSVKGSDQLRRVADAAGTPRLAVHRHHPPARQGPDPDGHPRRHRSVQPVGSHEGRRAADRRLRRRAPPYAGPPAVFPSATCANTSDNGRRGNRQHRSQAEEMAWRRGAPREVCVRAPTVRRAGPMTAGLTTAGPKPPQERHATSVTQETPRLQPYPTACRSPGGDPMLPTCAEILQTPGSWMALRRFGGVGTRCEDVPTPPRPPPHARGNSPAARPPQRR